MAAGSPERRTRAMDSTRSAAHWAWLVHRAPGGGLRRDRRSGRGVGLQPRDVRRQDERGDPPRWTEGRFDRRDGVGGDVLGPRTRAVPAGHRACQALDVALERRVVLLVIRGVVSDDVDDRRAGPPGVVKVREPVRQPGTEVEQGRRRLVGHTAVAVGGSGADAFEQRQHGPHLRELVERRDEVHLGRAGIREAHLHAGGHERPEQGLRALHRLPPPVNRAPCPGSRCRRGRTPPSRAA